MIVHLRIFLSSPGDVAEDRQRARDLIERLNKDHLLKDRVRLEAVSWDDRDAPTSMPVNLSPQEAVNRGLAKPSDCDLVVVLFWNRMGTELDRSEGLRANDEPYRSGTEWEFEDALNAPTQPERPVILLYRRTGFTPDASDPDAPKFKEDLDQRRKVNAFFDELRLRKRFATEVAGPNEFEDRLGNDLKHQISLILERQPAPEFKPDERPVLDTPKPVWHGSPYPGLRAFEEDDAPVFFGRSTEVDALLKRLQRPNTSFLIVIGASGSGNPLWCAPACFLDCVRAICPAADRGPFWNSSRLIPAMTHSDRWPSK